MLEYYVVNEENVDDIAEKNGQLRSYFDKTIKDCAMNFQTLVVFTTRGEWKEIRVHKSFNVEFVIHRLSDRYS